TELAVGTPGHRLDPLPAELAQLLPGRHVPEANCPLGVAGRGERAAVRREDDTVGGDRMSLQPAQLLARARVPEQDVLCLADGGQRLAIGREGEAIDGGRMCGEHADLAAGADVPQADAVPGGWRLQHVAARAGACPAE